MMQVSHDNRIAHKLIYNTPYCGISVGLSWGGEDREQNHNITKWNEVHHAMQQVNDGAGIYSNGFQEGIEIRNNKIHDIASTDLFRAAGIYLDDQSRGLTVRDNLVYCTGTNLFLNNTHGNAITNNIFTEVAVYQCFLYDFRTQRFNCRPAIYGLRQR